VLALFSFDMFFPTFTGGETGVRTARDWENRVQTLVAENNQLRAHLQGSQQMTANLNQQFYPFLDMVADPAAVHTLTEEQRQRRRANQSNPRQRRKALNSKDPALNARVNRYTQAVSKLLVDAVADCQKLLNEREAFRAMVQEDEIDARNKAADKGVWRSRLGDLAEAKAQVTLNYRISQIPGLPAGTTIVPPRRNGTRFITGQDSDEEGEGDEKEGEEQEGMEQEGTAEGNDEEAVESDETTIAAEEEESSNTARNEESAVMADAEDL